LIDESGHFPLRRCVGLNLDIPHWDFLAGTPPEWLAAEENDFVRRRIAHVHVSDHHVGHFSCTSPGSFNKLQRFSQWVAILHQFSHQKRFSDYPEFSNFVSCEMEACREKEMLRDCFLKVRNLIS
jgi:sugar phosphate isomerase/epimerase